MEEQQEIKLTPLQRAKSKYYQKNRKTIMNKIQDINKKRYNEDENYRKKCLDIAREYYEANKEKKKIYYQMKKQAKQQEQQITF
jgi:hypothetical protein